MKKILKTTILISIIGIIYLSLSLSPVIFKGDPYASPNFKKTIITAHRGASQTAPENTLASIEAAIQLNPDRIEIDVQQTLDSIVILMHDITLERTSNGFGLIKEQTFKDISKLDAGSWFSNHFTGEKIPTLEEVIKLINGKCQLIIEIKKGSDFYPDIEKHVLKLIQKQNAENWISIHSFDYKVLETVHNLNPDIRLHKLLLGKFKYIPFIISNKIEPINISDYPYIKEYSINYTFANNEIIHLLKSFDKKVNVWTVNDSHVANKLIQLGVDGIITDTPNLLKD